MNRAIAFIFCFSFIPAASAEVGEAELVKILRTRASSMFAKYKGVHHRRMVTSKELDPKSGKVRSIKQFDVDFWSYFYLKPVQKIISCKVNGDEARPRDCKPKGKGPKPLAPLFDGESANNYRFKLLGKKKIQGILCHKLKVIPLKKTEQHFHGSMYLSADKLEPVMLEGTLAKLPFPLKRFLIKLRFGKRDGYPVVIRGYVDLEVKVAIFYHARIVNRFTASRHTLLTK